MATKQAHKRLTKEYKMITESSPPYIQARPNDHNILEWHYIITGPQDTPYYNGQYHGTLTFPSDYPYKPPAIRMITPNGRFKENTRLCLSMSDFHPDTWNPGWSVATILNGLLSFMTGSEVTTGSVTTTDAQKKILARKSVEWNTYKNLRFKVVFPDVLEENIEKLKQSKLNATDDLEDDPARSLTPQQELERAKLEKPVDINDIKDAEDRIRAESMKNNDLNNENQSSNSLLMIVGIMILLFALFQKIK